MLEQPSFYGLSEHLDALSRDGDPLEALGATVDFADFRRWLVDGLGYGDGSKGGRPTWTAWSFMNDGQASDTSL